MPLHPPPPQIITSEEAERRGQIYDRQGATYLFDLDYVEDVYTVDAAYYGNISHFVNHSVSPRPGRKGLGLVRETGNCGEGSGVEVGWVWGRRIESEGSERCRGVLGVLGVVGGLWEEIWGRAWRVWGL